MAPVQGRDLRAGQAPLETAEGAGRDRRHRTGAGTYLAPLGRAGVRLHRRAHRFNRRQLRRHAAACRSLAGPRRPSDRRWQSCGGGHGCADLRCRRASGCGTMGRAGRRDGCPASGRRIPRGCRSVRRMPLSTAAAGSPRCTIFAPIFESGNRNSPRSRSTWSHRRERISPLRHPVSISNRIVAIASGDAKPSRSALRSAAPRRRYSSSDRNRSCLCSGYFLTNRHGLTPSERISQTETARSLRAGFRGEARHQASAPKRGGYRPLTGTARSAEDFAGCGAAGVDPPMRSAKLQRTPRRRVDGGREREEHP